MEVEGIEQATTRVVACSASSLCSLHTLTIPLPMEEQWQFFVCRHGYSTSYLLVHLSSGFFFSSGFEREKEDCFFVCTARRNVVQEVNDVCPEVQFAKAKPPDSVGKSSFNSAK